MINPWKKKLRGIRNRCYWKGGNYYKKKLKVLLTATDIEYLWFRDKAYLMKWPSIDRIDNAGDYTLDNCRYIEFCENLRKGHIVAVKQLTLNGKLIKHWDSIISVERALNIDHSTISKVCRGIQKTIGGFKWEYA